MSVPLATPIQKLPVAPPSAASAAPAAPEDPSVADVLNEMESVVSAAKQYQDQPLAASVAAAPMPMFAFAPPAAPPPPTKWFQLHPENGKRAAVAMVVALALFYPTGLFPALYRRVARLNFLEAYDPIVRVVLLGIFVYLLLTYVPL